MVAHNRKKEAYSPSMTDNGDNNESNSAENFVTQWFDSICEVAKSASKKTLPIKTKSTCIQRKISQYTRDLYEEKKHMQQQKNVPKKAYSRRFIAESNPGRPPLASMITKHGSSNGRGNGEDMET